MELNKTYCENCLDTMGRMSDGLIDLIVTSPPYDGLRIYNGYSFDFLKIAPELYRVIAPGGVLVWVVGDATVDASETGTSFKQALFFMSLGFNLHDTMIYQKTSITLKHNRYEPEFEYMFVFSKGKPKTFNPIMIPCLWHGKDSDRTGQFYGETDEKMRATKSKGKRGNIKAKKIKGNVWKYNTGYTHSTKDEIAFEHPAIFPEQLAADHIYSWSNENDIVYDPFSGSGTTCKMAHIQKRRWIASEISDGYVVIQNKRLAPYLQQYTLL
jgi:DNA modification methylase